MSPLARENTVAEFIERKIDESEKTQKQIADECGFERPNVITMFKKGATKIPIRRIGALAKAIEADPAHLMRLVLREYAPETWDSIEEAMRGTLLTANELALIESYRKATYDQDPVARVTKRGPELAIEVA